VQATRPRIRISDLDILNINKIIWCKIVLQFKKKEISINFYLITLKLIIINYPTKIYIKINLIPLFNGSFTNKFNKPVISIFLYFFIYLLLHIVLKIKN